jgi:diaminopimelate decarboxylase
MNESFISYQQKSLFIENCNVSAIVQEFSTPCYIYSRADIEKQWHLFSDTLQHYSHCICYAVKANSNLAILNILARLRSGFDIVSVGELERVLAAGGNPKKIIFSGVAKSHFEIERALTANIFCFNVESRAELDRLQAVAKQHNTLASIAIRVNPDISVETHPYITTGLIENKFGIHSKEALEHYEYATTLSNIRITGIACHIGSQLLDIEPFCESLNVLIQLADQLKSKGINIEHFDLGGGLGVQYGAESAPNINDYLNALLKIFDKRSQSLIFAPGRSIVARSGILVTKVEYIKNSGDKNFAIVDAGMNDLVRPALYEAWHDVIPVQIKENNQTKKYDIVGPVCESSDFLAKDRELMIAEGDLLAVMSSGAYGFSMSSNYNSRPKVAEVMVDGSDAFIIRTRESIEELYQHERLLPDSEKVL